GTLSRSSGRSGATTLSSPASVDSAHLSSGPHRPRRPRARSSWTRAGCGGEIRRVTEFDAPLGAGSSWLQAQTRRRLSRSRRGGLGMGRPLPQAALRCSAITLIVAVVVPVVSGGAAGTNTSVGTRAGAFPPHLVGTWTRKVTRADLKRTGATGIPAGTVCTLTIKKSGESRIVCTNGETRMGFIVPAGSGRGHINLGPLPPAPYTCRLSGP